MAETLRAVSAIALAGLLVAPVAVHAQASRSAALASELTRLLDQKNLDSVAARHGAPDQFVAALYFPGTQLLVVSARFPAPERMQYLLGERAYRDVYIDLNSASEVHSKIFVSDLGANGLTFRREDNQPFDTVDLPGQSVSFDGDWGRGRISEADYRKAFETADEEYARMLQSLIDVLEKPS